MSADAEIDPLDAYMASLQLPDAAAQQTDSPVFTLATSSGDDARQWRRTASEDVVAKNRRFRRLQQLLNVGGDAGEDEDAFFSDAMMQQRSPALFHFYLGQYLGHEKPRGGMGDGMSADAASLSSFLMKTRERGEMETRRLVEQEGWGRYEARDDAAARRRAARLFEQEQQEEEEDDSSSEEEESKGGDRQAAESIEERRRQLVEVMSARFLQGGDGEFVDYAAVDADAALDDLDEMDRDAQDRYFATDD